MAAELKTPVRTTLLPNGELCEDTGSLRPLYQELIDRPIPDKAACEQWLKDRSALEAAVSEEEAWRYIRTTLDTADKVAEERYADFVSKVRPDVERWTDTLNRRLMELPFVADIEQDEAYRIHFRGIREQLKLFREENLAIEAELRKKGQHYAAVIGAMSIEHDGKELTLPQAAALLESPDRSVREQVYSKVAARRSKDHDALDELFDSMVALRHEVALNAGSKNFRDHMYRALGRFDHTPEDAFAFHESVEKHVVPIVARIDAHRKASLGLDALRPWDLAVDISGEGPLKPFSDAVELTRFAIEIFDKVDATFADHLRTMRDQGLLDLESRPGKAPGGYNYPLYQTGAPFIFMNAVGTHDDLVTMMHEGGHAVHSFRTHDLPLTGFKQFPSEVAELASMSMELLTMDHWHLVYDDPAELKRAKREHLERAIGVLPWVATVDAFQHAVYEHPFDERDTRRKRWCDAHLRFSTGVVDWSGLERVRASLWHKQLHIFEVPFYYIEYGIAQLGALGVWANYRRDPKGAIQQFKDALSVGYTRTLPEIYATAGVRFDLGATHVKALMTGLERDLQELGAFGAN